MIPLKATMSWKNIFSINTLCILAFSFPIFAQTPVTEAPKPAFTPGGQIITPPKKTEDMVTVQQCHSSNTKVGLIANTDPEGLKKFNLRCNQIYALGNEITLHQLSIRYQQTLIDSLDGFSIDDLRKDGICLKQVNDATSQKFNMVNTREETKDACKARLNRQLLNARVQLREKTTANNKAIKDLVTESEKEGVALKYDDFERRDVNATVLNDFYILIKNAEQSNNEVALQAELETEKEATYDPTIISENLSIDEVKREQISNPRLATQLAVENGVEIEKGEKSELHGQVKEALNKDKSKLKQSYESDKTRAKNEVLGSNTPQGAKLKSELKKGSIQYKVIKKLMEKIEEIKLGKTKTSLSDLNIKEDAKSVKVFLGGEVAVPVDKSKPGDDKLLDKEIEETLKSAPTQLE